MTDRSNIDGPGYVERSEVAIDDPGEIPVVVSNALHRVADGLSDCFTACYTKPEGYGAWMSLHLPSGIVVRIFGRIWIERADG